MKPELQIIMNRPDNKQRMEELLRRLEIITEILKDRKKKGSEA